MVRLRLGLLLSLVHRCRRGRWRWLRLGVEGRRLLGRSRRSRSMALLRPSNGSLSWLGSVVCTGLSRLHGFHRSHVCRDGVAQAIVITLRGTSRRKEWKAASERIPVGLRERRSGGCAEGEDRQRKVRGVHGGGLGARKREYGVSFRTTKKKDLETAPGERDAWAFK